MPSEPLRPLAKPAKAAYRRNLPHLQHPDRPLFVTFRTFDSWILPDTLRPIVLRHCLHDHRQKIDVTAAVVMPDHVHLLFACRTDGEGNTYGMSEILSGIKGASAHSVNRLLNRRGHVWQDETFDHILRCEDSIHEAAQYICQNPVRKGLVQSENAWPWLWRSWIESAAEAKR